MEIGKRQAYANALMKQTTLEDNTNNCHVENNARKIKKELLDLKATQECEINMVSSKIARIRHVGGSARFVQIEFSNAQIGMHSPHFCCGIY